MMKLEDICVSLELAKQLKDEGYPQESAFEYFLGSDGKGYLSESVPERLGDEPAMFSAPTAAEIIEKISSLEILKRKTDYVVGLPRETNKMGFRDSSLVNSLAKMWLYLKKEGLL